VRRTTRKRLKSALLLEVFRRQVRQNLIGDLIRSKCRLVLPEAEASQPTSDIHRHSPKAAIIAPVK
jgi:hypothetical protein